MVKLLLEIDIDIMYNIIGDIMIKAIATDLDGTLFYPKRRFRLISTANRQFIRNASASGKEIILVTGRNIFVPRKVNKKFALSNDVSVVACNGARIIHKNEVVFEKPIESSKAIKLYNDLINHKDVKVLNLFTDYKRMFVNACGMNLFMKAVGVIGLSLQFAYFEPFIVGEKRTRQFVENNEGKIFKIMPWFGLGKKGIETARRVYDELVEKYGDDFDIWFSDSAIEIMEKDTNKANSLTELIKLMNIKPDEVAVVGDSGNDIPLFERFKHSFVMGQAPEEVKAKASVVLKSFADLENYIK